jgi:hypothetical protein
MTVCPQDQARVVAKRFGQPTGERLPPFEFEGPRLASEPRHDGNIGVVVEQITCLTCTTLLRSTYCGRSKVSPFTNFDPFSRPARSIIMFDDHKRVVPNPLA